MSSPIKPPRGAPPAPPAPGNPGSPGAGQGEGVGSGAAEGPFRSALDRADAGSSAPVQPAASEDPILRELQAGRIEPAEALERMVQRALEAPAVAQLSPALRAELEAHLRQSLRDDPSLATLARDLSHGQ